MRVFVCKDNIEDILTAIYTAWESGIKLGHENIRISRNNNYQLSVLDEYEQIEADPEKAEKVSRSIKNKISYLAYQLVFFAMLSCEESSIDDAYRFLIKGFKTGPDIVYNYTDPVVSRMHEIKRNVGNEACSFREFVRFNSYENSVYISHIEPKSNIISIVGHHFADRMPSENWMIIDDTRGLAVVHPKNSENYIRVLSDTEISKLESTNELNDEYTIMWKTFFDAIAIRQRTNYECQRNLFPIWKRKNAVEFMDI